MTDPAVQADPALSVMLDEWHRQCHAGATQIEAMRAVLAAYRRQVLASRPDAEHLAWLDRWISKQEVWVEREFRRLLAALADETAARQAAEASLADIADVRQFLIGARDSDDYCSEAERIISHALTLLPDPPEQ